MLGRDLPFEDWLTFWLLLCLSIAVRKDASVREAGQRLEKLDDEEKAELKKLAEVSREKSVSWYRQHGLLAKLAGNAASNVDRAVREGSADAKTRQQVNDIKAEMGGLVRAYVTATMQGQKLTESSSSQKPTTQRNETAAQGTCPSSNCWLNVHTIGIACE